MLYFQDMLTTSWKKIFSEKLSGGIVHVHLNLGKLCHVLCKPQCYAGSIENACRSPYNKVTSPLLRPLAQSHLPEKPDGEGGGGICQQPNCYLCCGLLGYQSIELMSR